MDRRDPSRRPLRPLDDSSLQELALRYVGKYATTKAKLRAYLLRKIRERGWAGERTADLAALANRFAALGYVDDAAYALAKSRALSGAGYGKRRLADKLRLAGIDDGDSRKAMDAAESSAVSAALRFAERRRIGPFAPTETDRVGREKAIAAMIRAGHPFSLARAIVKLSPGEALDQDELSRNWEAGDL